MNRTTSRTVLSLAGLALVISGGLLLAGPLSPPAGPVTSTYKTLTEVEPRTIINDTNTPGDVANRFKITQSGSYYLDRTWNFTSPAEIGSKEGILVDADDVTIDLNGFSMKAINNARDAILINAGRTRVRILNGHLDNWGAGGVKAPNSSSVLIDHVTFNSLGADAILVNSASIIRDCTIRSASGFGIIGSNDVQVENVVVTVTNGGISCGTGSIISRCDTYALTGTGIAVNGGKVRDCTASLCTTNGITAGAGGVVEGCRVVDCTGVGITVLDNSGTVSHSAVRGGTMGIVGGFAANFTDCTVEATSSDGIRVGAFGIVSRCIVRAAGGNGIGTSDSEFSVLDCVASSCTGNGIECGGGGVTVERCAVRNNLSNGIRASADCIIRNNLCDNNGATTVAAGILVTSIKNRIEGNICTDADFGIQVTAPRNIIIGNNCGSNTTNYSIAIGNSFGAIVQAGTNGAAISGNTAAAVIGTTDPHANFSY